MNSDVASNVRCSPARELMLQKPDLLVRQFEVTRCGEVAGRDSIAVIPTPLNAAYEVPAKMRARSPDLVEALHVAVVIGAPTTTDGARRDSLLVACDALARRWHTETLNLAVMA